MSVIVYTAILGGCDSLKPAPAGADRCVCFSDDPAHLDDPKGWTIVPTPLTSPRRDAWHLRCVAHELFPDDDTIIWIDGSFALSDLPLVLHDAKGHDLAGLQHDKRHSCYAEGQALIKSGQSDARDVHQQLAGYQLVGFAPTALTIACLIVRSATDRVRDFNLTWDAEIQQHAGDNTQLSLDYAAWKSGLAFHHLQGSRHHTPYGRHNGPDHKARRKPYR